MALGLGPFGTNMLQEHFLGAHLGNDETWFVRRQGTSMQGGGVATMLGWQGGIWIKMTHALTPNNVWGFWKDLRWFVWSDTFKSQEGILTIGFYKIHFNVICAMINIANYTL